MLVDYHIHTKASPDAEGSFEDYIKNAKKKGLNEIGFSEHVILLDLKDYPSIPLGQMPVYAKEILELKNTENFPIRFGVELDFVPNVVRQTREFIQQYPFDYVIGSVHIVEDWVIDSPRFKGKFKKISIDKVYGKYFSLVQRAASSGLFDIIGHCDLVKIWGFKPKGDYTNILADTVDRISEYGLCVEVNTSGLRRPCREIYPGKQLLQLCQRSDVPITLSSDAHKPTDVGRDFDKAIDLLKEVGYNSLSVFSKRKTRRVNF